LIAFKTIELLLLVTRVLVLLFFAQQTIRHIKKNGGHEADKFSVMTFVCLGTSFLVFLIYGILRSSMDFYEILVVHGDPIAEQDYKAWLDKHHIILNVVFAILRHPAYCLDNVAFYCNIERWRRLIGKEFKTHSTATPSTLRSGKSKKRYDKRWFKVITGALIGISATFMLL
jgi:uncharacterized protein with PQ loop repeat